jgi:hypothetical protein
MRNQEQFFREHLSEVRLLKNNRLFLRRRCARRVVSINGVRINGLVQPNASPEPLP